MRIGNEFTGDALEQHFDQALRSVIDRLFERGERWVGVFRVFGAVVPRDREIASDDETAFTRGAHRANRSEIVHTNDRGDRRYV